MDKYEFKLKIDEMKALVSARNYQAAAEIAETINWRKIRNLNALVLAGEVFEQVGRYEESKEILLMAYDKSPIGRNIIYRLAEIAIRTQKFDEAQEYYDEFVDIAPHDNLKYVLKYKMTAAQGLPYREQIKILEELKEQEYSEEWAYELAYLYHKDMQPEKCVEACDELILWFGDGIYVEKALELKMHYQPLTKPQDEKYRMFREKRTGVIEVKPNDFPESGEIANEALEIPYVQTNTAQYHTANLQEEIARGMQQIHSGRQQADGQVQPQNWQQAQSMREVPKQPQSMPNMPTQPQNWQDMHSQEQFQDIVQEPARAMTFEEIQAEWEKTKQAMQDALQEAEEPKTAESKEKSLEKAEQLMQRLLSIVPQLASNVGGQKSEGQHSGQEDQQLSGVQYDLEQAGKIVAGINQLLQEQIDSLQAEERQEQIPEVDRVSDPTREMPKLPENLLLGKEIGAIEKEEMDGSSLQNFSLDEEDNPVMNAWKEAPPGISAIDLLQRVRMEKNGVHFTQAENTPLKEPETPERAAASIVQPEEIAARIVQPGNAGTGSQLSGKQLEDAGQTEVPLKAVVQPEKRMEDVIQRENPAADADFSGSLQTASMQGTDQPVNAMVSDFTAAERVLPEYAAEESRQSGYMTKEPIQSESMAEERIQSEHVNEEPMLQEYIAEEPISSEYMAEEPMSSEYTAEEPMSSEYTAEEPMLSKYTAEEPMSSEYMTEQPIPQEYVAKEPMPTGYMPEQTIPSEFILQKSMQSEERMHRIPQENMAGESARQVQESKEMNAAATMPASGIYQTEYIPDPLKNKEMNAQPVYENEQENLYLATRPRFLTQAQLQAESAMDGKKNIQTTNDISSAEFYENGLQPEGQNLDMMKTLTSEQKQIFSYFVPIAGMEAQIYDLLNGVSTHLQYDKHALSGNIIIEGISGSGKTVLIMDIIKVLQKEIKRPAGKTGKIDANALNQKDLDLLIEKISGGCLIIESAGKITRETAVKLSRCMENDHTGTLYIMEDTAEGIQKALERDSSFASKFTEKITIPLFSADELVEFGKAYANDLDYDIDEMGVLALYKRISSIQKLDHVTTLTEVKEIVDEAIENAERGVLKKVFGMLTATRANDDNYVILREKDFEE